MYSSESVKGLYVCAERAAQGKNVKFHVSSFQRKIHYWNRIEFNRTERLGVR